MAIKFNKKHISENKILLEFEIEGGVITPEELPKVLDELKKNVSPEVEGDKTVILSGRGPIWLYGAFVHELHPFRILALFDPRLSGGVVVASHDSSVKVGDVIKFEYPQ